MNFTQNEKISQVTNTTLVVGIDISSETHYARAFDWINTVSATPLSDVKILKIQ